MEADTTLTADQPINPKSKRRWNKYIVGTLILFALVFAISCSWFAVKMQQAKRQKEAAEELVKLGCKVAYDYEYEWDSYSMHVQGRRPPSPEWLRNLLGTDFFSNVTAVGDTDKSITDDALIHLKSLTQLQCLNLINTEFTDAGLEHLKGLTQLQVLNLCISSITDYGLETIKGMTQLRELRLWDSPISDIGLEKIKGLTQLQTLDLRGTKITDAGLVH